jgi:hypothetical protein
MAQHVSVDGKRQLGSDAKPFDKRLRNIAILSRSDTLPRLAASSGAILDDGFASRSVFNSASGISQCLQTAVPIGGAMMSFNIGVEITYALAMRALALQRHLAQGYSESDFIAA